MEDKLRRIIRKEIKRAIRLNATTKKEIMIKALEKRWGYTQ